MRESPAIKVASLIKTKGADIVYHDPWITEFVVDGKLVESVDLTAETLAEVDAVIIVTDHSNVDYQLVVDESKLILDTRNVLKSFNSPKVVRL